MRTRFSILSLTLLLLFVLPARAAQDFAFPGLMDVLCRILQAEDIPSAMEEYGPVTQDAFEETVFHHKTWTVDLDQFTLVYDVCWEQEEDGTPYDVDYMFEARTENPGAAPFFHDLRQAHGWVRELGKVTLDSTDQVEVTARPFPGEESMDPLWWRLRVFCGSGDCRMIRFFWNDATADHNTAFCR